MDISQYELPSCFSAKPFVLKGDYIYALEVRNSEEQVGLYVYNIRRQQHYTCALTGEFKCPGCCKFCEALILFSRSDELLLCSHSCPSSNAYVRSIQINLRSHTALVKQLYSFSKSSLKFKTTYLSHSNTLIATEIAKETSVFRYEQKRASLVKLPTLDPFNWSIDHIAAFIYQERLYYVTERGDRAYSVSFNQDEDNPSPLSHEITLTEGTATSLDSTCKNQTFLFGSTAIIVMFAERKCRIYKLDLRFWVLQDITDLLKFETPIGKVHAVAADENSLFISGSTSEDDAVKLWSFAVATPESNDSDENVDSAPKLECPVCFDHFCSEKTPKMLKNCGHSICEKCEEEITVVDPLECRKTLTCPLCRVSICIPESESLPVNWGLKDLINSSDRSTTVSCRCGKKALEHQVFKCNNHQCVDENAVNTEFMCGSCALSDHAAHVDDVTKHDYQMAKKENAQNAKNLRSACKEFEEISKDLRKRLLETTFDQNANSLNAEERIRACKDIKEINKLARRYHNKATALLSDLA